MKIDILNKKYDSLGFVEALIALMVSSIVGVILMQISASTLRELHQLDIQDAVARYAVSTAVNLQKIATQDMTKANDEKTLSQLAINYCYGFDVTDGSIEVGSLYQVDKDRSAYSNKSLVDADLEYFRIFCVRSNPGDAKKIIVEIIVGSNKMDGEVTSDKDVKDYSYYAVINK